MFFEQRIDRGEGAFGCGGEADDDVCCRAGRGDEVGAGPFAIATLEGGKEVAFSEGTFGGTVSTRPEDIATVVASWESIRDEALPMSMSRDLIAQIAEEWEA